MGRFLGVLILLAAVVVGVGYYQGWFTVARTDSDHSVNVNVQVDKEKMREDKDRAKEEIRRLPGEVKEKAREATSGKRG